VKKLLIIAIVAVLAITSGVFAFTYTTATTTIGVTVVESDFAEVSANLTGYSAPEVFGKYSGTWPTGTLFDIAPASGYNGDLVIQVYLVNTGDLIPYYQHLNMKLEFQDRDNIIADDQGIAQVLNLQNAAVTFDWSSVNGTSPFYVKLTGGGYRLHKWKTVTGDYQPQLWAEVTQR
jgi:hypothetical protein